ncbi:MAG: hypothetical protein BEN18_03550 [Epulopiscium sp. Nuni2H_MBin001]|nr:MAG: hypothetical protein BEN18_03550 [Epulopiscium sp. Nuni2H_MBin001]
MLQEPVAFEGVTFEIEESKVPGDYALKLKKNNQSVYVISKYKPKDNLTKLINLEKCNKKTMFIFIGYGMGYLAQHITNVIGKKTQIIVLEPSQQLLDAQLAITPATPNIVFFSGTNFNVLRNEIRGLINPLNIKDISVVMHPHYDEFYTEYLKDALSLISDIKRGIQIDINTVKKMDQNYIKNCVANLMHINKSRDFAYHKDRYKDIPAVIVSAGPSLDKNLEYLKDWNGLIFCAGRTIVSVRSIGKDADFAGLIDYKKVINQTFMGHNDVPLIALLDAGNTIIEEYRGDLYFVEHTPIAREMAGINLPKVNIGGSVATLCLDAAHYMGCNPIVFIGQDLSYSGNQSYSETCNIHENRERIAQRLENKKGIRPIPAYNGGEVLTSNTLLVYLRWIEHYIQSCDRTVEFINATEGGAKIAGTIQMPFKDVVEKYKHITKPQIEHNLLLQEPIDLRWKLEECIKRLKRTSTLCREAADVSSRLSYQYANFNPGRSPKMINQLRTRMKALNKKISSAKIDTMVGYMFSNSAIDIMTDDTYKRQLDKKEYADSAGIAQGHENIYKALDESIYKVIDVINTQLEKETSENKTEPVT